MSILAQLYAESGSDVILHTVELASEAWGESIVLVRDYVDHVITTEDSRVLTAVASGIDVALPKRDNKAAQKLNFAIDGVRLESTKLIKEALDQLAEIRLIYRVYTSNDLSQPAERPFHFFVHTVKITNQQVMLTAGMFDFIDMRYPRIVFDSETAPCLKFIQ